MYYYLGYGSVSIVTLLLFLYTGVYMYVLLSTVICCMNVFYVDYSSLWLMFICCNIDYIILSYLILSSTTATNGFM